MATRRAIVTGASSGIGREFARQLAAQGVAVTCVARREERLQTLVKQLPGEDHHYIVADLATEAGTAEVAQAFTRAHYDLLVNNAGLSILEPFFESELTDQENILNVNCGAVMTLAHAFLRSAQPGDALINVASVVSFLPTPAQPMYSASKAFVAAFSECLWDEQRERDVYVMALCPGVTTTEFISTATGGESDGDNLPQFLTQTVEQVVSEALKALKKRHKAVVVTGWANRLLMLLSRLLTRHRLLKTLSVMGDPERAL